MPHELPLPVNAGGTRWYRNAGLLIESAVELDELAVPAPPGKPDLVIKTMDRARADAVALRRALVKNVGTPDYTWLEVSRTTEPEAYLLRWPGQLDVLIPDGAGELHVFERGELEDSIARLLLCHALSFVLPAHGRETVHASAAEVDGHAIVITGDSGMGKSTLATALTFTGGRLLADDVGVIGWNADGLAIVEPSSTRTWLLHDVASQFSGNGNGLSRRHHKVTVGGKGMPAAAQPAPVRKLIILRYRPGEEIIEERLTGQKATIAILSMLFNRVIRTPERLAAQFEIATALAKQAEIVAITWEPNPTRARSLAERMIAEIRGTPVGNGHARRRLLARLREAGLDGLSEEALEEPLLQTSEVAALLRTSDRTIRSWADAGKLTYIKTLGGRRLFPASGVASVLNAMNGRRAEED